MHQPICVALLCLAACAAQAQGKQAPEVAAPVAIPEASLKAGLWDVSIIREIPGTPYRRTVSSRECHGAGAEHLATVVLPKSTEDGQSCQYREPRLEGEVLSWQVACSGKTGSVQGTASITFSGGAYKGSAALQRKAGAKITKMTDTYEGKWVEACQ